MLNSTSPKTGKFWSAGILCLLFLFVAACSKDEPVSPDMGYRYFPVNPGHWMIYQVDSIAWDKFNNSVDTFNFQIKEVFESEFIDEQGRTNIRIERYKRNSDTSKWVIKDVWFALRTASTAEKVEENKRFVKMIFPVQEDDEWNGNAGNSLEKQDYTYVDINQPYTLPLFSFDSTVTVIQNDLTTAIGRNFEQEVYAADVGMIYKKFIDQETLPTGVIRDGCYYSYTLLEWGD